MYHSLILCWLILMKCLQDILAGKVCRVLWNSIQYRKLYKLHDKYVIHYLLRTASVLCRLRPVAAASGAGLFTFSVARLANCRHLSQRPVDPTLAPPLVVMVTILVPISQLCSWPPSSKKSATCDLKYEHFSLFEVFLLIAFWGHVEIDSGYFTASLYTY